jgi:hypothetical protein
MLGLLRRDEPVSAQRVVSLGEKGGGRIHGTLDRQLSQRGQHPTSAIGSMFERMRMLIQLRFQLGRCSPEHRLGGGGQVLHRMREVQNAHCI